MRPGITEEEFRVILSYFDGEDNLEDRNNDDVDSDLDFEGLHFNHSAKTPPCGDANYEHLYKLSQIINMVLKNSQSCYSPKKAIDEGMIASKCRLLFQQYMPAKPTKYDIKAWMAKCTNGYVMNFEIYMQQEALI